MARARKNNTNTAPITEIQEAPAAAAAEEIQEAPAAEEIQEAPAESLGDGDGMASAAEEIQEAPAAPVRRVYKLTVDKVVAKLLGKASPEAATELALSMLADDVASKTVMVKAARLIIETADESLHSIANAVLMALAPRSHHAATVAGEERVYKVQGHGKDTPHIKLPVAAIGAPVGSSVRVRFNHDGTITVSPVQAKAESIDESSAE